MTNVIDTKNLGKKYIISHEKEAMVRHIMPMLLGIKKHEEFWALQDINLEIKKGECLGIIGRNGVGKTTLLNLLAGITFPTQGTIKINGRVSAILGLGAGFHPELTGIENIYLNASLLGLKIREIKERLQEIVAFAELANFIDAPLKTYSAGMLLRLGFAIAVNVDFDILLIDEMLSVGDIAFQHKCIQKLKEFRKRGKTLVMVSQSTALLGDLADSVILLQHGRSVFQGEPRQAAARYIKIMSVKEEKNLPDVNSDSCTAVSLEQDGRTQSELRVFDTKEYWGRIFGTGDVEIKRVRLLNSMGQEQSVFEVGQSLNVWVDFVVMNEIEDSHFGVAIFRDDGTYCYGPNTRFDGIKIPQLKKGIGWFSIEYQELNLLPGHYKVSVVIWEKEEKFAYAYHCAAYDFQISSACKDHGVVYLKHSWHWQLP